jgi:hypothetical protein
VISGFRRKVAENWVLLGYCAASSGKKLLGYYIITQKRAVLHKK